MESVVEGSSDAYSLNGFHSEYFLHIGGMKCVILKALANAYGAHSQKCCQSMNKHHISRCRHP